MRLDSISEGSRPTALLQTYSQEEGSFVADKVFPKIKGGASFGEYYIFDKGVFNADELQIIADGGVPVDLEMAFTRDNFVTEVWGASYPLTHKKIKEADSQLKLDKLPVKTLKTKLLIRKEVMFASKFMTTGKWATDVTPETLWDAVGSDPIGDIATGILKIQESTGYTPETLTVSAEVHKVLRLHPQLIGLLKDNEDRIASEDQIKNLLGVKHYLVSSAITSTGFIFGKNALLTYSPNEALALEEPSAGYTIMNDKMEGSNGTGVKITVDKTTSKRAEIVHYDLKVDIEQKLTGADLGYFFNGVIS